MTDAQNAAAVQGALRVLNSTLVAATRDGLSVMVSLTAARVILESAEVLCPVVAIHLERATRYRLDGKGVD